MVKAYPYFLSLLFFVLQASATDASAAVSAQLSSQDIDELESVVLTIRASDTRQTETLDLKALENDFEILNTNTSSNYRFVNGREQSWVDYQITLQPKRVGELTIPGIEIGRDTTPSMSLRVRRLSDQMRDVINSKVFFESEVSAQSIYVQSQLILTRSLYYSQGVQLYSDLPGPPEIENAVVLTLGETTSSKTTRDNEPYGVIQQTYAIFPEASGSFTIPSVNITASVRLNENGRFSRKGVRVATEEVEIEIKPVPAVYPADQPWLPASSVSVLQKLDAGAGTAVGDTLTHEFLIQIIGNVGSVAPPQALNLDEDVFRQYPQAPVINDDTNGGQVVGARLQTTSVVPVVPGNLTVPAQNIYWWNTTTESVELATTEPITFLVTGEAIQKSVVDAQQETQQEAAPDPESETDLTIDYASLLADEDIRHQAGFAIILLLLFAIAVHQRLRIRSLWEGMSFSQRKQTLRSLKEAKSDSEFYAELLLVLRARGSDALSVLAASAPEVLPLLDKLRAANYGQSDQLKSKLEASERRAIVRAIQATEPKTKSQRTLEPLPPLYPS